MQPSQREYSRYGKRVVKHEDSEESTGYASEELRKERTQRASQDMTKTESMGVGENYVIWMPMDHILTDAQKASADLSEYWGSHGDSIGTNK